MKPKLAENQIALIDDLPEHSNKKDTKALLYDIRRKDGNIAIPPNYVYVQKDSELAECVDALQASAHFSLDTETRGLKWWAKKAVSLNVYAPSNNTAYFVPNRMVHAMRNFSDDELQSAFEDVLANPEIGKIGHNFKHDIHFVRETWNVEVVNFAHDTLLASIVLNENEDHDLEALSVKYLKAPRWKISHSAPFECWPIRTATLYACRDAEMTYKLYEFQLRMLSKERLAKLYSLHYDMEMPVVRLAVEMEKRGVAYDLVYHNEVMTPAIRGEAEKAAQAIFAVTGPINLNTPEQVASAFFDTLGMPRIDGNHVHEAALTELKKQGFVVADHMLTYRKYGTIDKMFVKQLPKSVVNGRIHGTLKTMGADSGRMSMSDPNLQQLPKRIGPVIRRAIIPSPGKIFVAMDFNQMELRMLAHFSEDERLIQIFSEGQDIHTAVMCSMLGVSFEEYEANKDRPDFVAKRVLAKTVNFGVLYGMGAAKLAWKTNTSLDEAKTFIKQYFTTLPRVKKFINRMHVEAYDNGYVETVMGRKRRLPEIRSSDKMIASMAERIAVNAPIQGSVADLAKMTMLEHDRIITENRWPYDLLLQIHDELIYEVPRDWLQHHQSSMMVLKHSMENIFPLRVPIVVNLETLDRWGDKTILEVESSEDEDYGVQAIRFN